jgi:hypothetical protein
VCWLLIIPAKSAEFRGHVLAVRSFQGKAVAGCCELWKPQAKRAYVIPALFAETVSSSGWRLKRTIHGFHQLNAYVARITARRSPSASLPGPVAKLRNLSVASR